MFDGGIQKGDGLYEKGCIQLGRYNAKLNVMMEAKKTCAGVQLKLELVSLISSNKIPKDERQHNKNPIKNVLDQLPKFNLVMMIRIE